ncbi:hypothetical protein PVAP13_4NG243511 [Panicum virgatum]|uniref:Uncharacterized protein n=1 Tax=Panicum virgatum TaxID=38727 RepID=A0A8T0TFH7_PANVG|nr:hypothetical protein PVAP13_4NG243511 [Panicum virgatum]
MRPARDFRVGSTREKKITAHPQGRKQRTSRRNFPHLFRAPALGFLRERRREPPPPALTSAAGSALFFPSKVRCGRSSPTLEAMGMMSPGRWAFLVPDRSKAPADGGRRSRSPFSRDEAPLQLAAVQLSHCVWGLHAWGPRGNDPTTEEVTAADPVPFSRAISSLPSLSFFYSLRPGHKLEAGPQALRLKTPS